MEFINNYSYVSPKYAMISDGESGDEAYLNTLRSISQSTYSEIIDQIDAIVTIFETECREVEKISDPALRRNEISTLNANGIMGWQLTQLTGGLVHDADRNHCLNQENMKRYKAIEERATKVVSKLCSMGFEGRIDLR